MSIFDYFRFTRQKGTASVAKERLQIIVAHERGKKTDYLPLLQQELLAVIGKYVAIDPSQVKVELEHSGDYSMLELNITLPGQTISAPQKAAVTTVD